jgi:hypothetical protein
MSALSAREGKDSETPLGGQDPHFGLEIENTGDNDTSEHPYYKGLPTVSRNARRRCGLRTRR